LSAESSQAQAMPHTVPGAPPRAVPGDLPRAIPGDGSFPAGTPIATPDGEVAVETLARGDLVLTPRGPVAVRHVETATADPATAPVRLLPVLFAAGACGDGLPDSDLLMPPQQLIYMRDAALPEGALAAAGALVNGSTIRRTDATGPVDWVRLELERPGLVIAAGLPVAARHDPTAPPPATILPPGPAIAALRARLTQAAAPAPALATVPEPTPEPAASFQAAPEPDPEPAEFDMSAAPDPGTILRAVALHRALAAEADSNETTWHFTLPAGAPEVLLLSPPGVPATTPADQRAGARRYGVAIRAILLDGAPVALDGPELAGGFHEPETSGRQTWRWTTGEALLALAPAAGPRRLTVEITDWHSLLVHD